MSAAAGRPRSTRPGGVQRKPGHVPCRLTRPTTRTPSPRASPAPAVEVPDVEPGAVLAFLETGAYQEACAANFNGLPLPATVLVCGATAEVIKRRETIEDVLVRDIVPERLRDAASATGAA